MDWLFSLQPECLYPSEGISRWADRGDSHYLQLCYAPAAKGKCWGHRPNMLVLPANHTHGPQRAGNSFLMLI